MKRGLGAYLFAKLLPPIAQKHHLLVLPYKAQLLQGLKGRILEIGPGSGINLSLYPREVEWIGLEPNPYFHPLLLKALAEKGLKGKVIPGVAESIPLPSESVDGVVATFVLCSVQDPAQALREIHRVLKPGGVFAFVEHVAAPPNTPTRRIQDLIQPLWSRLGDGCHPNRETQTLIQRAGFKAVEVFPFRLPILVVSPHLAGRAYKKSLTQG